MAVSKTKEGKKPTVKADKEKKPIRNMKDRKRSVKPTVKAGTRKPAEKKRDKVFDKKAFEELCGIMCTQAEICDVFRTTDKTLVKWVEKEYGEPYSEVYKKYSADGKISLRRLQMKSAKKGNVSMLIWLGKQYLRQAEKVEQSTVQVDLTLEEKEKLADKFFDDLRDENGM